MRKKILVIDDDIYIAELLRIILKRAGFEVTTLFHGSDAIDYLDKEVPDIILLDVSMPGFDGFEILEWLRNGIGNKSTPVIMLSGHNSKKSKLLAKEKGANDYVVKPFNLHALTQTIKSLTEPAAVVSNAYFKQNTKLKTFETNPPRFSL